MNSSAHEHVELRADFADRVLDLADRHRRQKRRLYRISGACAGCVCIAAIVTWMNLPQASRPFAPAPMFAAPQPTADLRADTTNPLSYLFPDAEPLARIAAEDGGTDREEGAAALFDESE